MYGSGHKDVSVVMKCLKEGVYIKNWNVALWFKVLFSDESEFTFYLEVKVPEE